MEAIKNLLHSRLRNQLSNLLLFGSMIGMTGAGLAAGTILGVLLAGRTGIHSLPPVFQLVTVLGCTIGGFALGVMASVGASPLVLRYAFFARKIGEWHGVTVYSAGDEDLPGRLPNVFVAGFGFGRGPFRPAIFAAEGAIRILSREALEAVFAHELSHLACQHLTKRMVKAIGVFLVASLLTSMTLIGLHWSGYAEIGGFFSIISGILPAVLTWMSISQMSWRQEFEADENAVRQFGVSSESLLNALVSLQKAIGGGTHPLVTARMEALRLQIRRETAASRTEDSVAAIADDRAA